MKKFIMVLLVLCVGFGLFANGRTETADSQLSRATEASMREANAQIGMPSITRFTERKLMKMILELRDRADLICYAYSYSEYTGEYTFIGQCIGYGLPYSVQYTSPAKITDRYGRPIENSSHVGHIMPQQDPNGLFMPSGLSATWVMLIDPDTGEPSPMYMEPSLTVSQFPLPARICKDGINK